MTDSERPLPPGPRAWAWSTTDSPVGPLGLAATPDGLLTVVFHADADRTERALSELERHLGAAPATAPSACHDVLAEAADQLRDYFAGRLRAFSVPLDWSLTSGFNRRTLRELLAHVPYGTVVAYQDLAIRLGDPGAARAVGTAMGSNPLPIVVPCHRVIGSDGGLGGFGPGLEAKRVLLSLEGVLPEPLF